MGGKTVCPSKFDDWTNLLEWGKDNYRDNQKMCSTHATYDPSTGQLQIHVDLYNPLTAFLAHQVYDTAPDTIYRMTGRYLL